MNELSATTNPEPAIPTFSSTYSSLEAPYHCTAEWHTKRLGPMCTPLHSFALHISHNHLHRFSCSAVNLAIYFGCDESSVRRALKKLADNHFLELLYSGNFRTNDYMVRDHTTWAFKYPGRCVTKLEYNWIDANDPLGRALYVKSGGRVKWQQYQINNLRKLKIDDDEIEYQFQTYYHVIGCKAKPTHIPLQFYRWAQNVAGKVSAL